MSTLPILQLGSVGPDVVWLQRGLNGLGGNFNNFKIDGIFGPKTQTAVRSFQDENKLTRDGIVGPITWEILKEKIRLIQQKLNSRGYNAGVPDGWFGPTTTNAVIRFQQNNNLYPEGIVNPRTRQKLFNPYDIDGFEYRPTYNSLSALNPYVASLAQKFITLANSNGLNIRITEAFRSWDDQDRYYAQGRTVPGDIITNARGGESYHNWGLAFDAVPLEENGQVSNNIEKFKKMGKLGTQVGLEWGGNFKDISDLVHFQYTFGLSTEDLLNGKRPPVTT